jgi:hypothetical protein
MEKTLGFRAAKERELSLVLCLFYLFDFYLGAARIRLTTSSNVCQRRV